MINPRNMRLAGHVASVGIRAMRIYFYFDNVKAEAHVTGLDANGK
jgi:hypothetical protein